MLHTDTDYAGFKAGKCLSIATKFAGPGADAENAETVAEMERAGYVVHEMPRAEACKAHLAAIT